MLMRRLCIELKDWTRLSGLTRLSLGHRDYGGTVVKGLPHLTTLRSLVLEGQPDTVGGRGPCCSVTLLQSSVIKAPCHALAGMQLPLMLSMAHTFSGGPAGCIVSASACYQMCVFEVPYMRNKLASLLGAVCCALLSALLCSALQRPARDHTAHVQIGIRGKLLQRLSFEQDVLSLSQVHGASVQQSSSLR